MLLTSQINFTKGKTSHGSKTAIYNHQDEDCFNIFVTNNLEQMCETVKKRKANLFARVKCEYV